MKYTTICIKLRSPKGKLVDGIIVVRDNFILSKFSDPKLAKQLYEYDKAQGEDVSFNEKLNSYIKKYQGKKRDSIVKELEEEIKKAGGQLISKKNG